MPRLSQVALTSLAWTGELASRTESRLLDSSNTVFRHHLAQVNRGCPPSRPVTPTFDFFPPTSITNLHKRRRRRRALCGPHLRDGLHEGAGCACCRSRRSRRSRHLLPPHLAGSRNGVSRLYVFGLGTGNFWRSQASPAGTRTHHPRCIAGLVLVTCAAYTGRRESGPGSQTRRPKVRCVDDNAPETPQSTCRCTSLFLFLIFSAPKAAFRAGTCACSVPGSR